MPPTTRKKAQATNKNSQALNLVTAEDDLAIGDVVDPKHKDDNLFERVFDPHGGVTSDDHDSDHSDYGADKKKRKRKTGSDRKGKAKRRFTRRQPPPPALPDVSDDEYAFGGNVTEEEEDGGLWSVGRHAGAKKAHEEKAQDGKAHEGKNELPQVLRVEASSEGGGKTVINLNLADLLTKVGFPSWTLPATPRAEAAEINPEFSGDTTMVQNKIGFLDLPLELRLKTYRYLFREDKAIEFDRREFSRSSHFLRTCKTVLEEGREVLYGENSFHFNRETAIRGRYYEKVWKEVGYKDIRRFLEAIGPASIAHFKYLSFVLTDGADNRTRTSTQIPERKFVNDPHLHQIFHLIGANATLNTLAVQFAGRAWVTHNDFHFLKALTGIKCHHFVTIYRYRGLTNKCLGTLKDKMKAVMRLKDPNDDGSFTWADVRDMVQMVYEGYTPFHPGMLHWAYEW
ncbi:uncharacterized protein Z520_12312 [Fonsecaea multimorphosa CBS 102226]|uniref:EF-hand domain-containing protein n=1 Tax=Fonsecaea multimorphosa CBS 102226 TaxID=1442371 RepID=A0A0D2GR44_9EURO|nr:uncharacterized protein Z520_12312 [Fonsecaea multimorphosa CBS 102226]KIX91985.1 hypothetical protein Z520_12312 [Fonsecaea multimorphosa CBS 102226]OAL19876.1 hypothetical protein AYO22_09403 [Fonsecaea multimorphosa]